MKCAHCDDPATIKVTEPDGREYGLCFLHNSWDELQLANEFARDAATFNLVAGTINRQYSGLLSPIPELQVPLPRLSIKNLNVGNVHVENSHVGIINTGMISRVESAIGNLHQSGNAAIAGALAELIEATKAASDLNLEQRNATVEHLGVLADEAQQSVERRRLATVRFALGELATYASGAASLSSLWDTHGGKIWQFFGL